MWHWSWMSLPANCGRLWLGVVGYVLGWGLTLVVLSWHELSQESFLVFFSSKWMAGIWKKWIWNIETDVILWPLQLKSLLPLYSLHQEANYEQEAKNAQMFAENFGDDPTVKIPKAGKFSEFIHSHPKSIVVSWWFSRFQYTNITRFTVHLMVKIHTATTAFCKSIFEICCFLNWGLYAVCQQKSLDPKRTHNSQLNL